MNNEIGAELPPPPSEILRQAFDYTRFTDQQIHNQLLARGLADPHLREEMERLEAEEDISLESALYEVIPPEWERDAVASEVSLGLLQYERGLASLGLELCRGGSAAPGFVYIRMIDPARFVAALQRIDLPDSIDLQDGLQGIATRALFEVESAEVTRNRSLLATIVGEDYFEQVHIDGVVSDSSPRVALGEYAQPLADELYRLRVGLISEDIAWYAAARDEQLEAEWALAQQMGILGSRSRPFTFTDEYGVNHWAWQGNYSYEHAAALIEHMDLLAPHAELRQIIRLAVLADLDRELSDYHADLPGVPYH